MKLAAVLALALAVPVAANTPAITAALADPSRPAADQERDAARKPAEFLAFAKVKPGHKVADFVMGGGYWTRILAGVVGPKGKVYAYQPAEFIAFRAAYGAEQDAAVAGRANVVPLRQNIAALNFPEKLDVIVTVQNWHDMHLKQSPAGTAPMVAGKLFGALKPGGYLIVADNAAAPGTGFTTSDTLHRIDAAALRKEIEMAGFKFEGESPIWANPADPRTAIVFDPSIRGKADQFVYRFRKPFPPSSY
jgi:predicted methyltransferase